MKYWTVMKYREATDQEIQAYYETHPELQKLIVEDLAKFEDIHLEWGKFEDVTEFVVVPDVGIVPNYIEDVIQDDTRDPDWSSAIYEVYFYKIYKLLWFTVFYRDEFGEIEIDILPLDKFDETVVEAERKAAEFDDDVYGYFFEWSTRLFSNNKKFVSIQEIPGVSISDLEEIESFPAPGYEEPEDLRASLFLSKDKDFFVGVNSVGSISIMSVESEQEARLIISEIWS
jgi:hypothetical protein